MFDSKMSREQMHRAFSVEGPLFQHDSECCIYLGPCLNPHDDDEIGDLYICGLDKEWPSVLFRFGDEGNEYLSYTLDQILSTTCSRMHKDGTTTIGPNDVGDWMRRLFTRGLYAENGRKFRVKIVFTEEKEED